MRDRERSAVLDGLEKEQHLELLVAGAPRNPEREVVLVNQAAQVVLERRVRPDVEVRVLARLENRPSEFDGSLGC